MRQAFIEALGEDAEEGAGERLLQRARTVLDERPLAADAQGFAVGIVGVRRWTRSAVPVG